MESFLSQVWEALFVISPFTTVATLTSITCIYGATVWWYHRRNNRGNHRPKKQPNQRRDARDATSSDEALDNTVYLTMFHSHRPVFLYLASFVYGLKQYF